VELVERCREEGHASSDGELEIDVRSMAVPVRDRQGQVVAAISIAVRIERMGMGEFRDAFLPMLNRARDTLAARLPLGEREHEHARSRRGSNPVAEVSGEHRARVLKQRCQFRLLVV